MIFHLLNKRIAFLIASGFIWTTCLYSQTAEKPPGGGIETDPYRVSTLEHLHYISLNPGGGIFMQTADIDASASRQWDGGKGFLPIGSSDNPFRGAYNGNGFVIRGLYINRPSTDNVGFFGMQQYGEIHKVGLVNAQITGKNNVGGVSGSSVFGDPINECFVTGKIAGAASVGGLVGDLNTTAVIDCYTSCTVTSSLMLAGGLVGSNEYSSISECYATGNVSGVTHVGGLVGLNWNYSGGSYVTLISGCYYSGRVSAESETGGGALIGTNTPFSIINNCYWNSQVSGITSGYGTNSGTFAATGLTTAQMTHPASFAWWNFDQVWKIRDGHTYPALRYLGDNAPFAFADRLSEHTSHFAVSSLLLNDYDYETLQSALVVKIESLSAGHSDGQEIYFPVSAHMGDSLTLTYMVGEARAASHDTLWGNMAISKLIYFNRAPVISGVTSEITPEETPVSIAMEDITATDPDNDPVSLLIFQGDHYTLSGYTVIPAPDFNGILSVGMAASDGSLKSDTAFMNITVTAVNDAPVLTAVQEETTGEDTSFQLSPEDISASDADGDSLSFVVGEGENYSLDGLTIHPAPDFFGMLSVPLSVSDGTDTSAVLFLKISVTPVNDPPVIISVAGDEALQDVEYIYQVIVSDVDDTIFTYRLDLQPAGMTVSEKGVISWTPAVNIGSSGEVTLTVTDGSLEDTEKLNIIITNVNKPPVARDTTLTSNGNAIVMAATARDIDGTIASVSIDDNPHHGSVSQSGLSMTYNPDPGYAGTDSLSWHAVDNDGLVSNSAKLYITVTAITAIDKVTGPEILLYPNPCNDGFTINAGEGPEMIFIFDLNGKSVLSQEVKGLTRVNTGDLFKGSYIVKIKRQRIKLIKQ